MEKVTLADNRVTLYQGDCLALLAAGALPKDAAVITDPPYGIGVTKHAGNGHPHSGLHY